MATKTDHSSLTYLHSALDTCIGCRYLLFTMRVPEFLNLIETAYKSQGSIEGQRDVVRTATATRIRRRLAEDLQKGAIIPPIVVGATVDSHTIKRQEWDGASLRAEIKAIGPDKLSIIDGMQRTTVLFDNKAEMADATIRVELWLAPRTENLVYRMLILNTGQIPWSLRRQLEVVHKSLIDEIQVELAGQLNVYKADDHQRRTSPGEFQGNDVVEMYLAYNLRKPHVDKETVLADQFSKLDLIEAVSRPLGFNDFIEAMTILIALDKEFSRAKDRIAGEAKYKTGRHIFDKVSACAGFMAAYSQFVSGKVGMDRELDARNSHLKTLKRNCESVKKRLHALSPTKVAEFLELDTLREVSTKRGGALSIGEAERELFLAAFRFLFEEGENLKSMEPCWRSQ